MKTRVIIEVKVITTEGQYLLDEIHPHLNEGQQFTGTYDSENECVEIKVNGQDAVLWNNSNCVIIAEEMVSMVVKTNDEDEEYFDDLEEAIKYKEQNGGWLYVEVYFIDTKDREYFWMIPPFSTRTTINNVDKAAESSRKKYYKYLQSYLETTIQF